MVGQFPILLIFLLITVTARIMLGIAVMMMMITVVTEMVVKIM